MSSQPSNLGAKIQALNQGYIERLYQQTERVLDRHAEIQRNQRRQAIRILQAYVAGVGIFITLYPFIRGFFESLTIPSDPPIFRGFFGAILFLVGYFYLVSILSILYDIPRPAASILSPKALDRGLLGKLLKRLLPDDNHSRVARSEIRSVSKANGLEKVVSQPIFDFDTDLLLDRFGRISRNESVINYNTAMLHNIHSRIAMSIRRFGVGIVLFIIGLYLLGVRP